MQIININLKNHQTSRSDTLCGFLGETNLTFFVIKEAELDDVKHYYYHRTQWPDLTISTLGGVKVDDMGEIDTIS